MRLLQLYNQYRSERCGEECAVFDVHNLLKRNGVEARLLMRTSRGLDRSLLRKAGAFFSGVYSISAYREVLGVINEFRPDVMHVNNLYPLFSPSVLRACQASRTPIVMTIHNYGLTCPTMYHLNGSEACERCLGPGKEFWCVAKNCRDSIPESIAYALRSFVARRWRMFAAVSTFIVPTRFTGGLLVRAGYPPGKFVILRNMVTSNEGPVTAASGRYVAFAGRLSPEKGVDLLMETARCLPEVPFHLAGTGPALQRLRESAPSNVRFVGLLDERDLDAFYRGARFLVVPSRWYEMCPLVISQANGHGVPVVAAAVGGLSEIVDDGVTGLTFARGDTRALTHAIRTLWQDPPLCGRLGQAAYATARRELSEGPYFARLMEVYRGAISRQADADRAGMAGAASSPDGR